MKYLGIALILLTAVSCQKKADDLAIQETVFVRNNGADMPVYIRGNIASKVMILVVHGGPGGNGLEYRSGRYVEALEDKYAMAYWDQRGQGMSHGQYAASHVNIEQMVDDLDAVVKVMKAKYGEDLSIVLLGHSWGGTLTAKYMITERLQDNVKAWIEADGAHDIPKLNKDATRMFIAEANTQIAAGNSVDQWQAILDWASAIDTNNISVDQGGEINSKAYEAEGYLRNDGILSSSSGGITNSLFFGPTNPIISGISGNATSNLLNEVEELSMTDELHKVTIPCLFLWGKYDFVVPPQLGVDAYNEVSSAQKKLVIFESSGHSPMDNEWEKFTQEVIEFVDLVK